MIKIPEKLHPNILKVIKYIDDQLDQSPGNTIELKVMLFGKNPNYVFEGFEVLNNTNVVLNFSDVSEQMAKILFKLQNEFNLISINQVINNQLGSISDFVIKAPDDFKNRIKHLFEMKESSLENKELISQLVLKEKEITKLKEENKSLSDELIKKEDNRVIKTQNKILCGIIKAHYKDKSSRVSKIVSTLQREAGIDLNEKTIRTRVEEALKEDQSGAENDN